MGMMNRMFGGLFVRGSRNTVGTAGRNPRVTPSRSKSEPDGKVLVMATAPRQDPLASMRQRTSTTRPSRRTVARGRPRGHSHRHPVDVRRRKAKSVLYRRRREQGQNVRTGAAT